MNFVETAAPAAAADIHTNANLLTYELFIIGCCIASLIYGVINIFLVR
jgi:hypothetical protein